ncbi:hypothetical protein GCM10009608_83950 [Pseudonocardia alaniniphila]
MVFNGEIYNHHDLRKELEGFGYKFPDRCGGSILPALYHRYGQDFVEHLDGMYGIAVLDLRGLPTLILATDEAGMKPIYYHRAGGQMFFSSEIGALRSLADIGGHRDINGSTPTSARGLRSGDERCSPTSMFCLQRPPQW